MSSLFPSSPIASWLRFFAAASVVALVPWLAAETPAPGSLDPSFHPSHGANDSVTTLLIDPASGKIYLGGWFTQFNNQPHGNIVRLNSDGSVDGSFAVGTGGNGEISALALDGDGNILAGGFFDQFSGANVANLVRLAPSGSRDTTFTPSINEQVHGINPQADGTVVIGGWFDVVGGQSRRHFARLTGTGAVFTDGFGQGSLANNLVNVLVPVGNGDSLVGGLFTRFNTANRGRIARVNNLGSAAGHLVQADVGANGSVNAIAPLPDDQILIAGNFTSYAGQQRVRIARINGDGTLDTAFNPGLGPNATVHAIAVQPNGKIIIGGAFQTYNGVQRRRLARLHPNGSLDTTFDPGLGASNTIETLALDADGNILIGGRFETFAGEPRIRVARVFGGEVPGGYGVWAATYFSPEQLADPDISGFSADPDFDGWNNLQEYAFGGNPLEPRTAAGPVLGTAALNGSTVLTLSFDRLTDAPDVLYIVEASTDLATWTSLWSSQDHPVSAAESYVRTTVEDNVPIVDGGPARFLRVRLVYLGATPEA
ncbi:MAG: hypothetical protein EA425_02450 [Puniceicoccaceae bacterium]|nr:MAG: hypothetical protein EA425_02450 [Puniceicoccaceae bacterium]